MVLPLAAAAGLGRDLALLAMLGVVQLAIPCLIAVAFVPVLKRARDRRCWRCLR
jgi:hypothetical protein